MSGIGDQHGGRYRRAVEWAREAGDRTLEPFRRQRRSDSDRKADGSVVTETDRATETWLRDRILAAFPDDGVLGEEHGEHDGRSGYRWVLDPIDGTASFVHGVPLYGTLIAVEHDGWPVVGVIHMPALDETVYACVGAGAWHRTSRGVVHARVSGVETLDDATVLATSLDYFRTTTACDAWLALVDTCANSRGWSDCYGYVLLATGRADLVLEPMMSHWDIAPMVPIVEEALGRVTTWTGEREAGPRQSVATNGHLHAVVIDALAEYTRANAT